MRMRAGADVAEYESLTTTVAMSPSGISSSLSNTIGETIFLSLAFHIPEVDSRIREK